MMKLFLTIFWVAVGVVFLVLESRPGHETRTIIPLSWLAFLMAAFNLVRWVGPRIYNRARREEQAPDAPPVRPRPARPHGEEYNPDLDFNKPPQGPGEPPV